MSQHRPPNPSHAPPPAGHGGPESARPRSDGLTGAARVATVLAKAAKSSRLYPSEHELRRRFQEELFQTLSSVLEHRPEVRFEIRKHELRVDGHPVFDSEGRDEVIPGLLYWDGLRSLTFRTGLDASELDSFLQLLTDADSLR